MKPDWKRKLSSRKFWALLASFAASVLVIFRTDAGVIEQVSGIITAFGAVAVYILAEAKIDVECAKIEQKKTKENAKQPKK